jgi:glycylpeptide N-tetradecanoyltransferase
MSDSKDKGKAPKHRDDDAEDAGADTSPDSSKGILTPPSSSSSPEPFAEPMDDVATSSSGATKKLPAKMLESVLDSNPALKNELANMDQETATKTLANIDIAQLLTGLSLGSGKNQKDMASYKFWQTQPVPRFDDQANPTPSNQGPIKMIDPEKVSKTPDQLLEGFEWCTLDLTNESELRELYELLNNHYVEDDNAMFRFAYSESFLHWYDITV